MTQLHEAIARYHRLLESENYSSLSWTDSLEEKLRTHNLASPARPIAPVLRPHFLTQRQFANLVKAAEALYCAIDRVEKMALSSPALLARMQVLPAEKMLASLDPGYSWTAVTSLLDTQIQNGTLRFRDFAADTPAGVGYSEALSSIYYDLPIMKEFRKKYPVAKLGGMKPLLQAVLKAWKEFGGKVHPNIAILENRQGLQPAENSEFALVAEFFRREGYATEIVGPDQLEYRNGVLRKGDFPIHIVYRRIRLSEFLVRFDLNHPLLRAYRDRAVCMVNSFRSELVQKKAMFHLLTDETVTAKFPAAEKKAIREFVPWTRVVAATKTTYNEEVVDLPEFVLAHRERLVLRPNDDVADQQSFRGAELDQAAWERALKRASRASYVVQEAIEPARFVFPVHRWGALEMREMRVDVQPHISLGRVNGVSTWVSPADTPGAFSTLSGLAPTFVLESR
ncbi:MAG TPA: hypothetical protein VFL57_19905 [Bryobacteraceae bacterium]|nr:hypothetical protein [Bryobacteraceae bacterium]